MCAYVCVHKREWALVMGEGVGNRGMIIVVWNWAYRKRGISSGMGNEWNGGLCDDMGNEGNGGLCDDMGTEGNGGLCDDMGK